MKRQAGFTLIELVMVIVILGVLSAFALPRFADYGKDAREASLAGLAGALKSAASIAHAEQLIKGNAQGVTVNLEGQDILMVNGFPQASATGIQVAAQVSGDDYVITGGGTDGGDALTFAISATRANCQVVYTAPTNNTDNDGTNTGPFTVVVTDSGC